MMEQILSIAASAVIFAAVCLRLNVLKIERQRVTPWSVMEVVGLATLLGGCAGSMGEWFLPNAEFHAETIVLAGAALFAIAVSRGALCQVVARLQGWDGCERRAHPRGHVPLAADEFIRDHDPRSA
jgi:hypothetical protein